MQRMINEGFFLKLRWKSGLFLKLHWIFLSCNPVKTPKTPDSILKLRWTVHYGGGYRFLKNGTIRGDVRRGALLSFTQGLSVDKERIQTGQVTVAGRFQSAAQRGIVWRGQFGVASVKAPPIERKTPPLPPAFGSFEAMVEIETFQGLPNTLMAVEHPPLNQSLHNLNHI
jgi:hypothetical protein